MQELLSLWHWGTSPSWYVDGLPTRKLPELHATEIFMEASSRRRDELLTSFPALSPLWRMGGGAENFKLLTMVWSFW